MPRTLGQLSPEERQTIPDQIHREADQRGWSDLNFVRRGQLYRKWEQEYDLSHATVKDGIMKGFDVRQGTPKKGEAQIQGEIKALLDSVGVYVNSSPPMWTGKERADFLIGFNSNFVTHVVEVERADSWAEGLRQVLWYRAAYFERENRQIHPMLILFGDASTERFNQIRATCNDNHILLSSYKLKIGGEPESQYSLQRYLENEELT